jgi:D-lactate dehydrogenase
MKIVFDAVEPGERELYQEALAGHELTFLDAPLRAPRNEAKDAEILCIFVSSSAHREIIDSMPNLKAIVARSMGYDHIDLAAAKERGIVVQSVPAYGARTVAEFAFALILALSRKAYAAYDRLRTEGTTDVKDFEGFDLAGKALGVVGTGKIGKNMARIAKGFDMQVHLCDAFPDEAFAKEMNAPYCSVEELVAKSDIVSIHVPLLPQTKHLINADILAKFKPGSYLINTSRGGVVDTKALVEAMKSGKLAGAGLDVIEGERALLDETSLLGTDHHDVEEFQELVAAHALVDMPNVIVTPHIAFNSREAKREILDITVKDILSSIAGTPENVVKS